MPVCTHTPPRLSRAFWNRTSQHPKTCCGGKQRAESSQLKGEKVKQVDSFRSTPNSAFIIISMQPCLTLSKSGICFVIALQFNLSIGALVDYTPDKKYHLDTVLFRQDKIIRDKRSGERTRIWTFVCYVTFLDRVYNDNV